MPKPIEPADEFKHLSEQQVMQALADTDPHNPVAVEVARLVTGYSENFAAHCQKLGRIPSDILHITPRWPIEAVAMRLVTDSIRDEGRPGVKYGYARVSPGGKSESVDAQARQLTKALPQGIPRCACEWRQDRSRTASPRDRSARPRLARSTRDLLNTLAAITDRKAGFRSLGDTWADTITSHGRLMLNVLGGLAEFERDLIRKRTAEGRERAKARGVKLGRRPKLTPHQQQEARRRRDSGKETLADIARSYNVSHSTISRLAA